MSSQIACLKEGAHSRVTQTERPPTAAGRGWRPGLADIDLQSAGAEKKTITEKNPSHGVCVVLAE